MVEAIKTVSEAARMFNRSAETIRAWADSGKLKCQRTASGVRIFKDRDIERLRQALRDQEEAGA